MDDAEILQTYSEKIIKFILCDKSMEGIWSINFITSSIEVNKVGICLGLVPNKNRHKTFSREEFIHIMDSKLFIKLTQDPNQSYGKQGANFYFELERYDLNFIKDQFKWIERKYLEYKFNKEEALKNILIDTTSVIKQYLDTKGSKTSKAVLKTCENCNNILLDFIDNIQYNKDED